MAREVGHFKKGVPRAPTAGRKVGTPNKTTSLLKKDILDAAEELGWPEYDKKLKRLKPGEGGRIAYLKWIGLTEPKAFVTLLGRVLPLQITGEGGGPVRVIDDSITPAAAAQLYAEALKAAPLPMIDVTPTTIEHEALPAPARGSLPRVIPRRSNGRA